MITSPQKLNKKKTLSSDIVELLAQRNKLKKKA